jgi:4,5-DOPA dioxygenase extradiol
VLILGSGNVVHNLPHALGAWRRGEHATPDWARAFDDTVARALSAHDTGALVRAPGSEAGRASHPTPDHYLPLLYVAGASGSGDAVRFPITGFDKGSLSMRSAILG